MKLLGIDYGQRRIGLATAESETGFVRGLPTVDRSRTPDALAFIAQLAQRETIARIVLGLPLGGSEQETPLSIEARQFGTGIASATQCPVSFVDESFSSVEASRLLLHRSRSFRRNKGNRDRIAACLILQAYLMEQT